MASKIEPSSHASFATKLLWIGLAAALASFGLMPLDATIWRLLNREWPVPGDVRRILDLSEIFAHGFGVFLIAWCLWLTIPTIRYRLPRLVGCAMIPGLVTNLIKLVVVRYRPTAMTNPSLQSLHSTWEAVGARFFGDLQSVSTYDSQSFPSGHATTAFGLAIGLCWLFPKGRPVFLLVALLATAQRVVSGAHWTSDVLAGMAIAALVGANLLSNRWVGAKIDQWEAIWRSWQVKNQTDADSIVDRSDS